MASATPVVNDRFMKWAEALEAGDPTWLDLAKAGVVRVRTRDVVEAELLKTTVELIDYQSGTEESLEGVLSTLERLQGFYIGASGYYYDDWIGMFNRQKITRRKGR